MKCGVCLNNKSKGLRCRINYVETYSVQTGDKPREKCTFSLFCNERIGECKVSCGNEIIFIQKFG